ncbi:MAG: sodium:proton antiporter [Coriobacteriales bacterium]|nr:sodium:proton antiporter [Coriobacteriales bacterium]
MLAAVLVSSFFGSRFPKIPVSLIQIALGVAFAFVPLSFEMHFEPELFMVLFIAPLLFEDAKKMDKPSLWRLKYPVLALALGLVFCTVLVLGFAINLFAPSIPLAAAFALAAALAPTDAVSVSALKRTATISDKQSQLLQGESLLNDASSIVSFNFAIAAAITGSFSVWEAGGSFLIMFVGGMVLGVVLMLLRYASLRFLRARGVDSVSFYVLFEIITPVLVYLVAELIHVSGIIAVVAAGITHSFSPRVVTPSSARLNLVSSSVWSVISFTLNGLVFLMLGTQLPYVIARVWTGTAADSNFLIIFIVIILLIILVFRFVWVFVMHRNVNLGKGDVELAYDEAEPTPFVDEEAEEEKVLGEGLGELSAAEQGDAMEKRAAIDRKQLRKSLAERRAARRAARKAEKQAARADKHYAKLHLSDALMLSLTGVKGAITLAVILSIPLTLDGTTPFPERDLLIFLASGTILLSLVLASIAVPIIAPKRQKALHPEAELNAILDIYRKVIASLTSSVESGERSAVDEVVREYYSRISSLKSNNSLEVPHEVNVRRYAIELQLEHLQQLTDNDKVSSTAALFYINFLSHQLARAEHHSTVRWELKAFFEQFSHRLKAYRELRTRRKKDPGELPKNRLQRHELRALQIENYRYALAKLHEHEPSEELPERTVKLMIMEMEQQLSRLENRGRRGAGATVQRHNEERAAVEARALDLEREAINDALDQGNISSEAAKTLRDNVAMMELDMEDRLG